MYCCVLVVGHFEWECEWVSMNWRTELYVLLFVGSWTFCVGVWGDSAGSGVLNRKYCCLILCLYFGRHEETSQNRLLLLWTEPAMMWDWGSTSLDITTDGFVGVLQCWYGYVCCTVVMLAVLTDGRWKLAATYCNSIRCHHCDMVLQTDPARSAHCRKFARNIANITVTVDRRCLPYMTLHWKI